jgi:hypothetical protein
MRMRIDVVNMNILLLRSRLTPRGYAVNVKRSEHRFSRELPGIRSFGFGLAWLEMNILLYLA